MEDRSINNFSQDLGGRIIRGGTALTTAKLVTRGFDLVRYLTIARWVGPQEMGVYAVATLVLMTMDQFSETGLRQALIQKKGDITTFILPVRTVQAMRGFFIGLVVFFSAPVISAFFGSPRSLAVLRVIALVPLIQGFEPLFLTISQKELRFVPLVALQTVSSFVSLVIGLLLAYHRPNAWALVFSSLAGATIITIGAHILSDPHSWGFSFDWQAIKGIRTFGFWIFASCLVSYLFSRGGDWMIGHLLDVKTLAVYQMAFLVCTVATSEIGGVISQLSFPVFSHLQQDRARLQQAYRQTFGLVSLVTFAIAGFLCACSSELFRLILGNKWLAALPLVPWLTIWGLCSIFAGTMNGIFYALDRPKLWARTFFWMVVLLAVGIYPLTRWRGALGVAILMAGIGVLMQFVRYEIISRMIGLPISRVLRHLIIPGIAYVISVAGTLGIRSLFHLGHPLLGLVFSTVCLLIIYILVLALGHSMIDPSPSELARIAHSLFRRNEGLILEKIGSGPCSSST